MVNLGTLRTSFAHVCICIYRLILPDLILVSLMKQLELSVNALPPPNGISVTELPPLLL